MARGKGKYRLYDELEKNATEQKAKEVTDSLTALKKETDDAKKKLDADKKSLAAKEAELKKSDAALGVAEKESAKLAGELKAAEAKLTKARDTLKKQEASGTPEPAKLDALKKSVGEAEKSVASLKEKSQTLTRDKLEPVKGKKEELTKELEALRDRIALAETGHSGLAEKLKLMEDKYEALDGIKTLDGKPDGVFKKVQWSGAAETRTFHTTAMAWRSTRRVDGVKRERVVKRSRTRRRRRARVSL